MKPLHHIHSRRQALRAAIDLEKHFDSWEESCVPSYCHPNLAAAYISWWRLFKAARLAQDAVRKTTAPVHALDFGASIGELGHLIPDWNYHYIESEENIARRLKSFLPNAIRHHIETAPDAHFDVIFALDSLEHNKNYETLLETLKEKLKPGGVLILSGPTENWLYRFGRKLAGFGGHYHETNIYIIENASSKLLDKISFHSLPNCIPLFRISLWCRR